MKYYIGIDTGTTSISIAAIDESGELITSRTVNHSSFIAGESPESRIQNPERITRIVLETLDGITSELGRPSAIGFTGQMHGMMYVNAFGSPVSPLYTWQDATGNDSVKILHEHGLSVSSGYGLATHYHLQRAGKIPGDAAKMSTISDYIAMKLCGKHEPVLSSDMAASWGCFDLEARHFHYYELEAVGVDTSYLPNVVNGYSVIGQTPEGVPVVCSIGDNQASVKGSVKDEENSVLVNIGTGSQVSLVTREYYSTEGSIEIRPYGDIYLLAGSSLCGGRAYAMLEKFYRDIAGHEYYAAMQEQAEEFLNSSGLGEAWDVTTTFMGTRSNPAKRGSIEGINEGNFCAGAFTAGVIQGILRELHGMYEDMKALTGRSANILVGSGNGMRKNVLMQRLAGEMFGMTVNIPDCTEEAATGAALCAMKISSAGE